MMRDMFLIDGQPTYDPCGIGILIFGFNQQTLDACGVWRPGSSIVGTLRRGDMIAENDPMFNDTPRRGGMSVEQIKYPRPTPRRGDMSVDRIRHFPGGFEQPTYDLCGIGILIFGFIQQALDACGVYFFGEDNYNLPGSVEMFVACNENSEFSPRRGGMSVEQIKYPRPTPRRGDM